MKIKKVLLISLALCVLCACGKKDTQAATHPASPDAETVRAETVDSVSAETQITAKTEEEIFADIQAQDPLFAEYDLTFVSGEITQRDTDETSAADCVQCTVAASNDILMYHAVYTLSYKLDGENWVLDTYLQISSDYQAQTSVSREEADAAVAAEYDSYSYCSEESTDNQQIFYYGAATTEGPLTRSFDITLTYVFTMDGWMLAEMNAEETDLSASGRDLLDTMLSNAWDASVQTTEYVLFFKDGQGVRLNGAIPGYSWVLTWFTYTLEGYTVRIGEESDWLWNPEWNMFGQGIEEYGQTEVVTIAPVPLRELFERMAESSEVQSDTYWDDVMDLFLLYHQETMSPEDYAIVAAAQEDWQAAVDRDIAERDCQTWDLDGQTVNDADVWKRFYTIKRVKELLNAPLADSALPDSAILTNQSALQQAADYFGVPAEGSIQTEWDPANNGKTQTVTAYIVQQNMIERDGRIFYSYVLMYRPEGGRATTVDTLYIDAETGACLQTLM